MFWTPGTFFPLKITLNEYKSGGCAGYQRPFTMVEDMPVKPFQKSSFHCIVQRLRLCDVQWQFLDGSNFSNFVTEVSFFPFLQIN